MTAGASTPLKPHPINPERVSSVSDPISPPAHARQGRTAAFCQNTLQIEMAAA